MRPTWRVASGGQYAAINQNGRVDIFEGVQNQTITVRADYGNTTDSVQIAVTYDNQLTVECADTITGTIGNAVARYNSNVVTPTWSVTDGGSCASIASDGAITVLASGNVTVQAAYGGYVTAKRISVVYEPGTTSETIVDPETGAVTTTTTSETTDPQTGETTTNTTSVTTNEDGSQSSTETETVTNSDGSSTSQSNTSNSDGTSSESTTTTSAPDPTTGSVTSSTSTTNYDENGGTSGSSSNVTTENTDGSYTSSTTNYDAEGEPTTGSNVEGDTDGNVSTQDIEYDENGNEVVSGYEIDTSGNQDGEKTFNESGVNTQFYGFDVTRGFVLTMHFTMDFTNQPADQNENHHQVLAMKRATPEPWYGFQFRQTGTTKYIVLGTQFSTGSNVNTTIDPNWIVANKVAEYNLKVIYDPTASSNNFTCIDLMNDSVLFQASNTFPDLPELRYLTVCIGYALDGNGGPYRYSNINVMEFSLAKLPMVADPVITCSHNMVAMTCATQGSAIYYRIGNTGNYLTYSNPIQISEDTTFQAYAQVSYHTSSTVTQLCHFDNGIEAPVIDCDGEQVTITCETPSVDIWYRVGTSGSYSVYDNPIEISQNVVIQAYAELNGATSSVVTENCTYSPIVLTNPVIHCDGEHITITCSTLSATIYYRLDSTGNYAEYTSPITILTDTYVETYAQYRGHISSVVTETCIYNPIYHYENDYLTFKVLTAGTIQWAAFGSNQTKTIEYSVNNGTWTSVTSATTPPSISVAVNDTVRFRGTNTNYAGDKNNYSAFSGGTATYNIEGNIMSLIYGDNFVGNNTLPTKNYVFCSLFKESNAISAENLILPATTLQGHCYRALFSKATSLVTPPALPATTLATYCYYYMFENCPFTTAPELPAETLSTYSYAYMFTGCSNLNFIKCLATSISASNSTTGWVANVASSGTFVKSSGMSSWTTGTAGIPTNWVVQNDTALLPPTIAYDGFDTITISCSTPSAAIFYKLNRAGSFTQYSTALTVSADTYVEAYSTLNNQNSTVISQNCEYVSTVPIEASNRDIRYWTYSGQNITVPYSVNAIDGHTSNYAKGTFNFETTFSLRQANPTHLWFQHADQSASVYIDNTLVEKHWGGYNAFFVDVSNYVHIGSNSLKVALKNNEGNSLAPASGDFNFNATLGNVRLLTSPCLPDMKYGYDGFHVTSTVSAASATVNVATTVPTGASVTCSITDGTHSWTDTIVSDGTEMVFTDTIANPHLWNGKQDPHLYTITLEISKDGSLYHRFQRGYGLRYYSYVVNDNNVVQGQTYTGFLLNGQPYYLRGVCMHDDVDGKANALSSSDYTQEFAIIQELGCNFIRLAHYPHPKEVYDWCDQLGIIVQTEVPCVNKLQSTMPSDYYTHLTGQYTDMVNQHYNHPCIMFWGLSNETTTDDKAFAKAKIEEYTALIKSLDSERMVGYVMSHSYNNPSSYYNNPNVDWFGGNIYVGWYIDKVSNDPTSQLNTRVGNIITSLGKPLAFSEYGCGGTQHCHSDDPQTTTTKGNYERHDIEYQMWLHEGHIAAIRNFPQLLFTAQWQLFDIAVANRNEGYTVCLDGETTSTDDSLRRLNNKGLVERDHVTKKDTFYIYKAEWSSQRFVHICGKDYTKKSSRTIKCYTNDGSSLALYVNGTFVENATVTDHIAEFTARNFSAGDVVRVDAANTSDTFTF